MGSTIAIQQGPCTQLMVSKSARSRLCRVWQQQMHRTISELTFAPVMSAGCWLLPLWLSSAALFSFGVPQELAAVSFLGVSERPPVACWLTGSSWLLLWLEVLSLASSEGSAAMLTSAESVPGAAGQGSVALSCCCNELPSPPLSLSAVLVWPALLACSGTAGELA